MSIVPIRWIVLRPNSWHHRGTFEYLERKENRKQLLIFAWGKIWKCISVSCESLWAATSQSVPGPSVLNWRRMSWGKSSILRGVNSFLQMTLTNSSSRTVSDGEDKIQLATTHITVYSVCDTDCRRWFNFLRRTKSSEASGMMTAPGLACVLVFRLLVQYGSGEQLHEVTLML